MKERRLVALAVAAGAVDAISYLGLGKVFPANMTGNTVLLGVALANGSGSQALRSGIALAGFCAGVAFGTLALRRALALEGVLLGGLLATWLALGTPQPPTRFALIAATAGAMGLQSAFVAGTHADVSTTYITGTLTKGVMRAVARSGGVAAPAATWVLYAAGGGAGAFAEHAWHGLAVAIPLAIVMCMTGLVAGATGPAAIP